MREVSQEDVSLLQRLAFAGLDEASCAQLRQIKPQVMAALPAALDGLYGRVRTTPAVRRHFRDDSHIEAARAAQLDHWAAIAGGDLDDAYVARVSAIGRAHARIGLAPNWYIAGYGLVLEGLISTIIKEMWPKGLLPGRKSGADQLARNVTLLVKAALLDMDYSISVYLQALDENRQACEQEVRREEAAVNTAIGRAISALAGQELGYRIQEPLPPAFGRIRQDFNAAMATLGEALDSVYETAQSVQAAAREITKASDELASRTEREAASLEKSSEALAGVSGSVGHAAENAKLADTAVARAREDAEHGGDVVKEAITAMDRINDSSRQISTIIGVIDAISFQTNLLALNAGVEAARAGDAGRGFAVVATEVRALAQRSANAAKEIKQLITNSSREVSTGVDLVNQTGAALLNIIERVGEIAALVADIAKTTQRQASGLQDIASAINVMGKSTQENAAMVEETTAASHELVQKADEVMRLIGSFSTASMTAPNEVVRQQAQVAAFASEHGRQAAG